MLLSEEQPSVRRTTFEVDQDEQKTTHGSGIQTKADREFLHTLEHFVLDCAQTFCSRGVENGEGVR